jgi:hypothetical protein
MASEPLLVVPALLSVLVLTPVSSLAGRSEKPEVLPPRALLTATI